MKILRGSPEIVGTGVGGGGGGGGGGLWKTDRVRRGRPIFSLGVNNVI